jgi:hypothetical protein
MEPRPYRPVPGSPLDRLALGIVHAVRADMGCLIIAIGFLLLMALTVIFADLITPPPHNPFVS